MKKSSYFDPGLESLRGIAALAVVITHSTAIFRVDGQTAFWLLQLAENTPGTLLLEFITALFNAGSAVILFFVLSGYVLALSLRRSTSGLTAYTMRRCFRLLPPMWASIIVMWAVLSAVRLPDMQSYSAWFSSVYVKLTTEDVLSNAFLWSFKANSITWTMYVEVIGSALLPLILWMWSKFGLSARYGMLALFALLTIFLGAPSPSFSYLLCFYAGAMLATTPPRFVKRPQALLLWGFFLFVMDRLIVGYNGWGILTNTVGAVLVITGVINGAAERWLMHPLARNLGRTSYSVYLFHPLVIFLAGILIGNLVQAPGLLATAIALLIILPISLAIANAGYAVFEAPSIWIGQELTSKLVSNLIRNRRIAQLDA
jgi:peptidoglycan/LPS O-acetylase OafA/YrhL